MTETEQIKQDDTAHGSNYEEFCVRAHGTNVNDVTLLSTDYFNHFNEVIMLIGMIPDMPELLDDAKAWTPITYVEHFAASSIADRDLAIDAYPHVPARYKEPFETTLQQIDDLVVEALNAIEKRVESGQPERIKESADSYSRALQRLVDVASAIVHGGENVMAQDAIDDLIDS